MMMNNFNGSFGKKKSRIIRANESLTKLFEDAQLSISQKIQIKPSDVPIKMATKKIVDWAMLGRQFELNYKPKKKQDDIADKVGRFMDRIT